MEGISKKKTKRNVQETINSDYCLSTWRPMYDPNEEEIKRLSEELLEWSKTDDALRMSIFSNHKMIDPETISAWREKFSYFDKCYQIAFSRIGERREIGALKGLLTPSVYMFTAGLYDKSYRSYYKWKQGLSQNNDKHKTQDIKVIIEAAPSSDRVPRIQE